MWEFIKVVKWLVAIGVLGGILINIFYIMWMISWAIRLFYGAFCFVWISGSAINNVVWLTSWLIYAFLVVYLYRTFYGA